MVDTELPKLRSLRIEGILEFDNSLEHYLEVDNIFINCGQLIIGWENDPMLNKTEIVLTGEKSLSKVFGSESKNIGMTLDHSFLYYRC